MIKWIYTVVARRITHYTLVSCCIVGSNIHYFRFWFLLLPSLRHLRLDISGLCPSFRMRVNRGQYMPATTRFLFFTTFVGSSSILPSSSFSLIPRLLIRKIPRNLNYSCCYYRNHDDCQQKHQNFIRRLHPYQHRRDNNIISPSLLWLFDRTEIVASAASSKIRLFLSVCYEKECPCDEQHWFPKTGASSSI